MSEETELQKAHKAWSDPMWGVQDNSTACEYIHELELRISELESAADTIESQEREIAELVRNIGYRDEEVTRLRKLIAKHKGEG